MCLSSLKIGELFVSLEFTAFIGIPLAACSTIYTTRKYKTVTFCIFSWPSKSETSFCTVIGKSCKTNSSRHIS